MRARLVVPAAVRATVVLAFGACVAASALFLAACRPGRARALPEESCADECREVARQCTARQCIRGCNLGLDKIIERETHTMLACVAARADLCEDSVWAECAVQTGVHADGGPPQPPPPGDPSDEDEEPAPKPRSEDDDDFLGD
jgi:hypothetical protein